MIHSRITPLLICLIFCLASCIEEYNPVIGEEDTGLYVIDARITDNKEIHSITISRSASISKPGWDPVNNCEISILNDDGREFPAYEIGNGEYEVFISKDYLHEGASFAIEILSPSGELIRSSFEELYESPQLDSIYYQIEEFNTNEPGIKRPGVQFYIDFDGRTSSISKIKFEVEETWKFQVEYPIQWTWDGRTLTTYDPPDYSKNICWRTMGLQQILLLSTDNLSVNQYKKFPLHNVQNNSEKLLMGYSLLFRQLAVSNDAYLYFEKLQDNIVENGGLYESQPQQIQGNLTIVDNPDSRVLGYFLVAGVSERRIFYTHFDGLEPVPYDYCSPVPLDLGYRFLRHLSEPKYLLLEDGQFVLDKTCVDCTERGGVTMKPEFWPESTD